MRNSSRKRSKKQAELEEQSSSSGRSTREGTMSREERTKQRKILTERKRRERMDESYRSLEKILLTSGFYKKEKESDASVEKAIILEQSVSYIQNLQNEMQRLQARVHQEKRTPNNIGMAAHTHQQSVFSAARKMLNHSAPIFNKPTVEGTEINGSRPSFASLPPSFNHPGSSPYCQPLNFFPQFSTQFLNPHAASTDVSFNRESLRNLTSLGHPFTTLGYPSSPVPVLPHAAFQWHSASVVGSPLKHSTPIPYRAAESSTKSSSGLGTSSNTTPSMSSKTKKNREVSSDSFLTENLVQKFDLESETEIEEIKEKPVAVDQKSKSIWNPYF